MPGNEGVLPALLCSPSPDVGGEVSVRDYPSVWCQLWGTCAHPRGWGCRGSCCHPRCLLWYFACFPCWCQATHCPSLFYSAFVCLWFRSPREGGGEKHQPELRLQGIGLVMLTRVLKVSLPAHPQNARCHSNWKERHWRERSNLFLALCKLLQWPCLRVAFR
jgi:hypothetical protein